MHYLVVRLPLPFSKKQGTSAVALEAGSRWHWDIIWARAKVKAVLAKFSRGLL
jgi:hypothetical protein